MSNFSKMVKKTALWSVIIAIVLAIGLLIGSLCGFNKPLEIKDKKTLTVSLDQYTYATCGDEIKEDLLDELGAEYAVEGIMSGDTNEILFVFDNDVKVRALEKVASDYLKATLEEGATYNVSSAVEEGTVTLAKAYTLRAVIACVVLAILAFVYVSIRYKLASGITAGVSVLLSMLLTMALVAITRVYVTASVVYVISIAGLLTAAMTLFTLNNVRSAQKAGNDVDEEVVASSVAVKEVLYTAVVVAAGMLLVGILGKEIGIWFAVSALLAVASATFVSLFFAPAVYLSVKTALDKKPVKGGYVGAKKTSKKESTVEEAVEEAVEEIED